MKNNLYIKRLEFINLIENIIIKANLYLTPEVRKKITEKLKTESTPLEKAVLSNIIENSDVAKKQKKPLCQDSGVCVFIIKMGYKVRLNFNIVKAINEAVKRAHKKAYLRGSIVNDPFERINTIYNYPAIIHTEIVDGNKISIEFSAKGAGSENMSTLKIFRPTITIKEIKNWIIDVIYKNGARACPPLTIGIGIGGNFETCAILAKKALFVPLKNENSDKTLAQLESELYSEINNLKIGAMGLGGNATCIGVKILSAPCHIASMPVAININCHSSRHMKIVI